MHVHVCVHENKGDGVTLECNIENSDGTFIWDPFIWDSFIWDPFIWDSFIWDSFGCDTTYSCATSKTPNDSSEVQHRKLLTTHLKIQHSYMHLRARVHENKKDGVTLECNIANFKRLISIFTNS